MVSACVDLFEGEVTFGEHLGQGGLDVHQHLNHNRPLWWLPDTETPELQTLDEELRTRRVIKGEHFVSTHAPQRKQTVLSRSRVGGAPSESRLLA
jgi:hypothetical protein